MGLQQQILFFFCALGVFNGLLLCGYLFFVKKPKAITHYFLAFVVLFTCVRVGISCIYFFEEELPKTIVQIGLLANIFIGLFLLFYVKSVLIDDKSKLKFKNHLVIVTTVIFVGSVLFPFVKYPSIWDHNIRYVIHAIFSGYLVATFIQLKSLFFKKDRKSHENGVLLVFLANILVAFGFVVSLFTNYSLGPIWFSLVFYTLVLDVYFNRKRISFFSKPYTNKQIEESKATDLLKDLEALMISEKLYKNTNLKRQDISDKLQITTNTLSQLLNDNLGKTFSLFVNEFRVNEAKKLLATNQKFTIEGIGYEAGFSSKSSFYSTFKKIEGVTPSAYKKAQLTE